MISGLYSEIIDLYRYALPYERNETIIHLTSVHNNIYFRSRINLPHHEEIDSNYNPARQEIYRFIGNVVPYRTISAKKSPI